MIKHHSHIECGCDLCGKTVRICTTIHNAIKILRSRGWTVGMRNACCCPQCQKNGRKPVKKETSVMTRVPSYIINAIRRRAAAAERFSIADAQISEYCKRRGIDTEYICGHVETVTIIIFQKMGLSRELAKEIYSFHLYEESFDGQYYIKSLKELLAKTKYPDEVSIVAKNLRNIFKE
jgi:hypothetical protein